MCIYFTITFIVQKSWFTVHKVLGDVAAAPLLSLYTNTIKIILFLLTCESLTQNPLWLILKSQASRGVSEISR